MKQAHPVPVPVPVSVPRNIDPPRAAPKPVRKRSRVAVAVLCFWVAAALVGAAGGAYRMATAYRRFANSALGDNIRYIELRAAPSGPAVRLTHPAEIDAIRTWLRSADRSPKAGASARPADCPLTVVFGDGTEEAMQIGRTAPQPEDGAAEIEIRWHGYTRYADAGPVTTLLEREPRK